MISLMMTSLSRNAALLVPGVLAANARNAGAPSGDRPKETPLACASKRTASSVRVLAALRKKMASPSALSAKPSGSWFHDKKRRGAMIVLGGIANLLVSGSSLSQQPE